jgi:NAD(P)-dependent dehydrogenase (short-subunit alcohol dehydrogenase family)
MSSGPHSAALVAAISAAGGKARVTDAPGRCDLYIITAGLGGGALADRHWNALQQACAVQASCARLLFLDIHDGDSPAALGGLAGLARTLRREWTSHEIASYALPAPERAALVVQALGQIQGDAVLSVSGPRRYALAGLSSRRAARAGARDDRPGIWLISGGARGITAACATALAARSPGTFLLAGRSALADWPVDIAPTDDLKSLRASLIARARTQNEAVTPAAIDRAARALLASAEVRATLAAITATGASAHYLPVDLADHGGVTRAVQAAVQRHGAITGLVHGAGVLADRLALKKTRVELDAVFAPKVGGLINLLNAVDPAHLRHIGLFSSAAAVFGNSGQSDYAMANAWLSAAARHLAARHPGVHVKSFAWGPWQGGMVDATLAAYFAANGISLIGLDDGARIFAQELLDGDKRDVELLIGDDWATS